MLDVKALLVKITKWFSTGTNIQILANANAPTGASYGSQLRIRGNGTEGSSGSLDTYWIGISSDGSLYSGVQLNGASTITWRPFNTSAVAQSYTITALGKSWYFRRIGHTVYVDAPNDASGSIAAGTTQIGTLPDGLRPAYHVYLKCNNTTADVRLNIYPNGTVHFYHPSATSGAINCGFSGYTYMA